jgi:hypothetical protein
VYVRVRSWGCGSLTTGFIRHHHQVSLQVGETLQGKNRFEKDSAQFDVQIKSFRADNAPFNAAEFKNDLENKGQTISFSGVGAHHQNGAAKRSIKTITSWARTMMLHAILHWPEQTTLDLWPFAMDQAVYCWNHLPSKNERISPLEAFTWSRFSNYEHLKRLHVWGSPCYILDLRLQDEKKIPKWALQCRQGQYLGISLDHSTTVARILNMRTGYVSPQYHVLHDDSFTTVVLTGVSWIHFMSLQWNTPLQSGYERYLDQDYDRSGHLVPAAPLFFDEWFTGPERALRDSIEHERRVQQLLVSSQYQRETTSNGISAGSPVTGGYRTNNGHTNRPNGSIVTTVSTTVTSV